MTRDADRIRAGADGAPQFVLDRVTVRFGAHAALVDVDLEIASGEIVAFVGPSGAGKTTLLRLLNGTLRPTSGHVLVRGVPLDEFSPAALRELRASVGFVHQDLSLVPNLRALSNVLMGRFGRVGFGGALRALLMPPRDAVLAVHALLERVGIGEKLYERVDRLSGGQRQRVAIARALYQEPDSLLADEPVSSVDPARARDTIELLTALARERGLTLCASLHHIELAQRFVPRLIGMRHGRIVFDRPTAELDPADYRALYELTSEEMLADAPAG